MKLLKAFVRVNRADEVIRALYDAGAPGVTVSMVHGLGYGYEPPFSFRVETSALRMAPEVCKVEVVCHDEEVERLLTVLVGAAHTGGRGDGIVFVTPVERAVRIRTRQKGPDAFANR